MSATNEREQTQKKERTAGLRSLSVSLPLNLCISLTLSPMQVKRTTFQSQKVVLGLSKLKIPKTITKLELNNTATLQKSFPLTHE